MYLGYAPTYTLHIHIHIYIYIHTHSGIGPGSDCFKQSDHVVIPTGKWTCVEWYFNGHAAEGGNTTTATRSSRKSPSERLEETDDDGIEEEEEEEATQPMYRFWLDGQEIKSLEVSRWVTY